MVDVYAEDDDGKDDVDDGAENVTVDVVDTAGTEADIFGGKAKSRGSKLFAGVKTPIRGPAR